MCWLSKLMIYNCNLNDVHRVNLEWYNRTQRTAVSSCHHWCFLSGIDTGNRIVLFLTAGKQARGSARCGGRRQRRPASERAELFCSSPPTSASCCLVVQQTVCSPRAKRLRVSTLLSTQLLKNFDTHLTYWTQISSFRYCGLFNVSDHKSYCVEMNILN